MLTSRQNPLVKQIRKLHRAKGRQDQGQFLLEGTNLVEAAWQVGYPLSVVCCTSAWRSCHPQLWAQVQDISDRLELVSPEVLVSLTTTPNPDGIVATAQDHHRPVPHDSVHGPVTLALGLETIQDPGNLGTLIRTAAAADVEALWLSQNSVDLAHPKVLRATAGQWFRLPMASTPDFPALVHQARDQGLQVVATTPGASLIYWQADFTVPTLFLLGNEGAGLSEQTLTNADLQVKIPLAAGVESLNVAIAGALLLYEAQRQRQG
jgi:TrmH family RNA methyltransferase